MDGKIGPPGALGHAVPVLSSWNPVVVRKKMFKKSRKLLLEERKVFAEQNTLRRICGYRKTHWGHGQLG